ncbi:MAG: hypothetical protein ABIJ35_03755 [Acidobacteriota bacterium]
MKTRVIVLLSVIFLIFGGCATGGGQTELNISRGPKIPPQFISITAFSPEAITFEIRVQFSQESLYHIITDEAGAFLSEGWIRTSREGTGKYTATMQAKEGLFFEKGQRYLLCIGDVHPDQARIRSNNYQCRMNAWFTITQ